MREYSEEEMQDSIMPSALPAEPDGLPPLATFIEGKTYREVSFGVGDIIPPGSIGIGEDPRTRLRVLCWVPSVSAQGAITEKEPQK